MYIKFLFYESIIFISFFILNFYQNKSLGPPFTKTDLIAILISLPTYMFLFILSVKWFARFDTISIKNKILVSILAIIISGFITGFIMKIPYKN